MAVTADSVIVDVIANVAKSKQDVDNYASSFEKAMARIDNAAGRNDTAAEQRARRELARRLRLQEAIRAEAATIDGVSRRVANAQRNIGRQVADIGLGLQSPGVSPFLVLAQQGPQVVDALADVEGRVGKFATFLSGPVGAAIFATVTAAGLLASTFLEAGDSAESMAKDLEKAEIKARAADTAQTAFTQTLLGAAKASRELSENLTKQNQSQLQVAQSALAAAEAQRQFNIQTRQKIADQLREQLNNAKNLRDDIKRGNPLTSPEADEANQQALLVYTARITRLQGDYAIAQQSVADATNAVVQARIPLLSAVAEGRSSAQVKLTQQHAAAVDKLKTQYEKAAKAAKTSAEAAAAYNAYVDGVAAANDKLAASQEDLAQAKRDEQKAETEAAKLRRAALKDAKELQADLEKLESAYGPVAASARAYADELERIADLQARGMLSPETADRYRLAADAARIRAAGGGGGESVEDILNRPGGISQSVERDNQRIDKDIERDQADRKRQAETEEYLYRQREQNVRSLAGLYEDAFLSSSGSIWDNFKREGLRALAVLLARFTLLQFGSGGGGNVLGNLGAAAKSVFGTGGFFGRAGGGYAAPYSVHRVNETAGGMELLRMGPTGGEVIPLGRAQAAARGGGTTIINAPQFNMRGAVVTRELYADMERISNNSARRAGAASYEASQRSAPGTLSQYSKLAD